MNLNDMKSDLRVKVSKLETTDGMLIAAKHIDNRRLGATGKLKTWVPGHGGDVWFVEYDETLPGESEQVAAYCFTELELAA